MIDMGQIQAAMTGFGALRELIKGGIDAKADAQAQARIIDAMGKLGAAQDAMYALRDELLSLQGELAELKQREGQREAFESRLSAYELVSTPGGAVVYKFKGEPLHYACPNCRNDQRIEILQDNRTFRGKYRCTAAGCGAEFPINPEQPAGAFRAQKHNPFRTDRLR